MSYQRIGYIRVSSLDQNSDMQLEAMKDVHKVFIDKASGKDIQRPQFVAMMSYVREGDTIVVYSMDRLARNLGDLRYVVQKLTNQGIRIEFLKERLNFSSETSPIAHLMLSVIGAFAEFERSLIRERQREGIELAKRRGVYRGRKKSLNEEQVHALKIRITKGESKTKIARDFGISRETLYKYLKNKN